MRREWVGFTAPKALADVVRAYLIEHGIKFETSGCYSDTHFEILCNIDETDAINDWIDLNFEF